MTFALALSLASLTVSLLVLASGSSPAPSDFPHWWEHRPSPDHCYRAESNWRGTKVGRCACGKHRGQPWGTLRA